MAAVPTYKNISGLTEQPDSGRIERGYQADKLTIILEGKYADALSGKPSIGQAFNGTVIGDTLCTSATVEPLKGKMARLIYVLEYRNTNAVQEVNWQQIQKPLALNPRYSATGAKPLTTDDLSDLETWKAQTDAADNMKAWKVPGKSTNGGLLSANAQDYAAKWLKGTDNYIVFQPICRQTTIWYTSLTTGSDLGKYIDGTAMGSIIPGRPTGYKWLKTSDNAHYENGFWSRVEEWTGSDNVDSDLYPS